jgi:clathrin heavy chain
LDCSEELGDMVKPYDTNLALSIYLYENVPHKVVQCLAEMGQFDKIIPYAKEVNYQPDYLFYMRQILSSQVDMAAQFAQMLIKEGTNEEPLVDVNQVNLLFDFGNPF